MSPVLTNERRVRRARRSLYGATSHVTAAFAKARKLHVPAAFRGPRWLSAAIGILLLVQMATGILLSLHYSPDPNSAYASTRAILGEITAGWLVRAVHRWAGELLLAGVLAHVFVVFFRRAYARPRQLQWVFAFFLLQATLGFRFTGRLLPWDGPGVDAARRGLDLLEAVPVFGPLVATWLRGGAEIGPNSLGRFYTTHVLILPWVGLVLLVVHGWFLRRHGLKDGGAR